MVYLAKGGSWLLSGHTIVSLVSFLLAVVFANFVSQEVYGTYKYVLSIFGVLSITTLTGINVAVTRAISKGLEGSFMKALSTKMRFATFGTLASLAVALYYLSQGNQQLAIVFLIAAIFVPLMEPLSMYLALLQGRREFKISTIYSTIIHIISSAALIVSIFISGNIFIILLSYFTSYSLLRFIFLHISLQKLKPNNKKDLDTISFGKHLSFISVLDTIAGQLDKLLLWHFLGAQALAVYAFALLPVDQLRGFMKFIKSLAFPKFASTDSATIKKTLPKKMLKLGGFLIIPVSLYILVAPFFFSLFFPQYMNAVIFSQLYALTVLLFPKKLIGTTLIAHAKKGSLYIASVGGSLAKIVLFIVLIPTYGIVGAVSAEIGVQIFNTALLIYLFKKM